MVYSPANFVDFCMAKTSINLPVPWMVWVPVKLWPQVGEGQALGGRSLATALRARGWDITEVF